MRDDHTVGKMKFKTKGFSYCEKWLAKVTTTVDGKTRRRWQWKYHTGGCPKKAI